nr:UPF0182 family protein [Arthrobacter castelli]
MVGVLVVGFIFFSGIYADILWFDQLGYLDVFVTQNVTQAAIFIVAALIMGATVYASLRIAYGARPIYAPDTDVQDNLSRYQETIEPVRRLAMIGIPALLGLFAGTAASSQWQQVLLFFNQVPYGETDPEFGLDYTFYMISLPFLGFLTGFLISVVLVAGIAGILTHYLYGGIRLEERGIFTSTAARVHIAVAAAAFLVLQAANYWLDRYSTLTSQDGNWAGAFFTDVHAVIPTKAILAVAALIVAALFVAAATTNKWRLPLVGTAMLIITAVLASGVYPWVIQRFQVEPSEQTMEVPYIERNIEMTREAYGLSDIKVKDYDATTNVKQGALEEDQATMDNIRLLDPNLVAAAFGQLQQFRPYYQFPNILNVDRYKVDGQTENVVVAVRGLDTGNINSWINQHAVYTHGYGVVAASASEVAADGEPQFLESGIPSQGVFGDYQPRIYFGEYSPEYSVVGAPEGTQPMELDRPETGGAAGEAKTTFSGDGGPSVGNFFNRLVYAIQFQSTELLLSDAVNEESQILYDRDPRERVEAVAPYLTIDSNIYPAVVDGRVKWIVEGYTTNSNFPYSEQQQLESATTDSQTGTGAAQQALPPEPVNYIRNSVKATVDAYNGSVDLYAWNPDDPLLQAWQNVFPEAIQPLSEVSGDLMSHFRYPEDLFKVQRELLGTYHVTNPVNFYRGNQEWSVPDDPTESDNNNTPGQDESNVPIPPYYLSLAMPGQKNPAFQLTSPFIPAASSQGEEARNVLYGYLAANSNAGSTAGEKADSYGTLRLLELPTDRVVSGPGQAQNLFNSDPEVSQALNLLRRGASEVLNGNLLTLPVGGGILYVQPVYVQSSGESSYPTLQRVLVSFGEQIGFAPTLDKALDELFQGDSGVEAEGAEQDDTGGGNGGGGSGGEGQQQGGGDASAQAALQDALERANAAIQQGQAALAEGDFAAYGKAQAALNEALQDAIEAENQLANGGSGGQGGEGAGGNNGGGSGGASPEPTDQS